MTENWKSDIDFRYAPADWQSTICFPDDPHKSLVGKHGELRHEHAGVNQDIDLFGCVVRFGFEGVGVEEHISQSMEAPGVPIITTVLGYGSHRLELTAFATRRESEGRVDNVLLRLIPGGGGDPVPSPCLAIRSRSEWALPAAGREGTSRRVLLRDSIPRLHSNCDLDITGRAEETVAVCRSNPSGAAGSGIWSVRISLETSPPLNLRGDDSDDLLADARRFWNGWSAVHAPVRWILNESEQSFLVASSRNIQQSREKIGKGARFQVGPTVYRGLWIVDGYFLLEAARFLGMDEDARIGLASLWDLQQPDGGFRSGAGEGHWKDTPAALLTLARQADLSQNWGFFIDAWPACRLAVSHLVQLRDGCRNDGTPNGNYGLLPPGFGDSGIGGTRFELANTLWTLIGLNGLLDVATRLRLPGCDAISSFAGELRQAFDRAASDSMSHHPDGFPFLPLLMKGDPGWNNPDPRLRIRPQAAQIYLSHAITPGDLFPRHEAIVGGYKRLLRSILREEIPSETGWLRSDAVWPYSAAIFAESILALGDPHFARSLFRGFLNHASPLRAWREEQSIQGIVPASFVGDMPHNWASAECIRFLRNMLVLEDGASLSLAGGLIPSDAESRRPLGLESSPTKWGRVSLLIEPSGRTGWSMSYRRRDFDVSRMPELRTVAIPARLFDAVGFDRVSGAGWKRTESLIIIDPASIGWTAAWNES